VFYFLKEFFSIHIVIPIFKGSKGEDPKVFIREYKRACIGTGL
jgi:hypothetical protein